MGVKKRNLGINGKAELRIIFKNAERKNIYI